MASKPEIYAELDRVREQGRLQERQLQILVTLIDAYLNGRKLSEADVVRELADENGSEAGSPRGSSALRTQKWQLKNKLKEYYAKDGLSHPIQFVVAEKGFSLSIEHNTSPATNATEPAKPVAATERPPGIALDAAVLHEPVGSREHPRLGRALAIALTGLTACALLAIAFYRWTEVRFLAPSDGLHIARNTSVHVEGRGGRPWLRYYLVVEWQPYDSQPERFIQGIGPLHIDWTSQWNRDAVIGDEQTREGSRFLIYLLSVDSANQLKPGVDFDNSGKLRPSYPTERSSESITVYSSVPGRQ